jgi:hypothetical protein
MTGKNREAFEAGRDIGAELCHFFCAKPTTAKTVLCIRPS